MTSIEQREIRGFNARTIWAIIGATIAICSFLFRMSTQLAVQDEKLADIRRRLDRLEDNKTIHTVNLNDHERSQNFFGSLVAAN